MAYYECLGNNDHIVGTGDNFIVTLTGSHNLTTTATVCYIDKTTVCLLCDINLGNANWGTQCSYAWNYTININNKEYTGTCKIPTLEKISSKCAGYRRGFDYWTSTAYNSSGSCCCVYGNGSVYPQSSNYALATLPFIEITL